MNPPSINDELEKLRKALWLYSRAAGISMEDALKKKGPQLGYALRQEFRGLMPKRGAVRTERLEALERGEGVHVRQRVYDLVREKYNALPLAAGVMRWRTKGGKIKGSTARGLNLQALAVQRELNLRESGRGFLGQSSRFGLSGDLTDQAKAESRYGPVLASMGFRQTGQGPEVSLTWGGYSQLSDESVKAMGRARGQRKIAAAIADVTRDMGPYIERKLGVTAEQMGLK